MIDKLSVHWFDCEHPKLVCNKYTHELIQVPCGSCSACKSRKITRWVAPLVREASCWKYSFFVTLTYNDRLLPKVKLDKSYFVDEKYKAKYDVLCEESKQYLEFCNYSLPYCPSRDIQNFIKRFRENVFRSTGFRGQFRYFFSSDYGSTLFRPHWHGLIFTSNEYIADHIQSLVSTSWSLYNKARDKRYSYGIVDCQPAISAGQYVSAYIHAIDKLPAIYQFRDFRPKSFHSSNPPIGSNLRCLESPSEIVTRGLTTVTVYDPTSFRWSQVPLQSSLVRRLFPAIPSFSSMSHDERCRIYRLLYQVIDLSPKERRVDLLNDFYGNTFFSDYVTLNNPDLSPKQIFDKFDRIFYAYLRLFYQAQIFDMSVFDYDYLIERYFQNRSFQSLKKQFDYEDTFMIEHNDNELLNNVIDLAYNENERHNSVAGSTLTRPSPRLIDGQYFIEQDKKFNKLVKRKCDNAYLEKHPEFKKFH